MLNKNLYSFVVLIVFPIFVFSQTSAFIYGGGDLCDNAETIDIEISLTGSPPWNIVYAINGVDQPPIINTMNNLYVISTDLGGVYTISSVSDASGMGTTAGSAIVSVLESPMAQFSTISDTISSLYPTLQFNDISVGSISWNWNFGDNTGITTVKNPIHTFPNGYLPEDSSQEFGIPGIYQVSLIVNDINGCTDTTSRQLFVEDEYWMHIPNSFTPDLDSRNDFFCLTYHAIRKNTFYFKVFDMNGTLVFYTKNIQELRCDSNNKTNGWDGKHYESGKELPIGNYLYEVYFQDFEGWKHRDFGFLNIIR